MGMANISLNLMHIELGLSSFQYKGINEHAILNREGCRDIFRLPSDYYKISK
jgi:hypothetical protein